MRIVWVLLMVCLLPLRGWAGQSMAVDMAAQQVAQAVGLAAGLASGGASDPLATMPDDCTMHTDDRAAPTTANTDTCSAACSGCETCELCLAIASITAPPFQATPFRPRFAPTAVPHGFVSADSASQLKPPIS